MFVDYAASDVMGFSPSWDVFNRSESVMHQAKERILQCTAQAFWGEAKSGSSRAPDTLRRSGVNRVPAVAAHPAVAP
jgi:hypothetical protein